MAVNDLQLLAIPELANKHFFIPDYQRGYRWNPDTSDCGKTNDVGGTDCQTI